MATWKDKTLYKKGTPIIQGYRWQLQAEDPPLATGASSLEIVSESFPETAEGESELIKVLLDVTAFFHQWDSQDPNRASKLPRTAREPKAWLIGERRSSVNKRHLKKKPRGKPQLTVGLRPDIVWEFMKEVWTPSRTLTSGNSRVSRVRKGNKDLTGRPTNSTTYSPKIDIVGEAPDLAFDAIQTENRKHNNGPAPTNELLSFISLLIAYMNFAAATQHDKPLVRSYAKTLAPLMARTDFAKLWDMLSDYEKAWYGNKNGRRLKRLIRRVHSLNDLTMPFFEAGIQIGNQTRTDFLQGLTRKQWLEGIVAGKDKLTAEGYDNASPLEKEQLIGLGGYGDDVDTLPSGDDAGIFELRSLPVSQWKQFLPTAVLLMKYIRALHSGRDETYGE